jgi:hypothetical protein
MTDYRRFLGGAAEEAVLPYLGGPFVSAPDRRLRVSAGPPPGPGWWRFEVRGRQARPIRAEDAAPDLSGLPAVRGYWLDGYLVGDRGAAVRFGLGPPDEPVRFSPLVARRWPDGALLFDSEDFESGAEDEVRAAFDRGGGIGGVSGVPAPLRAAFGYAVALRTGTTLGIPVRPLELRGHLAELADEGPVAARRILVAARTQRAAEPVPQAPGAAAQVVAARPPVDARDAAVDRAATALYAAGATLRDSRWLAGGLLEVRYDYLGERFVSVVDGGTLRVVDAGICLSGEDGRVTLESLPAVIEEAVRTRRLYVTAW